ncbi:unnamed protein product [Lasius platythorax]|uniref:RNA-directed DNA polymerase n=1 Tax=Lasius platythorax TaxID=488582 RepID=A0AAV2MY06_9HYME
MSRPKNVEDVRRFLGMVTYYARLIPDLSTRSTALRILLRKNHKFKWTADCEAAFTHPKNEMASDRVLVSYDPNLPIVLTSDASPTGIAAVMSHMINDQEKPIAYASRSLTAAERNYSKLDREALVIVFGVNHFFNYLFGLRFTLVTDNEPLTRIFHHKKHLPSMTSSRLLRYAAFLSGFNYVIKFKRGETNENVDCLSRASITQTFTSTDILMGEEVHQVCSELIDSITTEALTAEIVATETEKDDNLGAIKRDLLNQSTDSSYTPGHLIQE